MMEILLAAPDLACEADLVAAAPHLGLRIVRRCVDTVDLYAAAATSPTTAVVISGGLPRLGRDAVDRMSAGGRRVVGLVDADASAERLRRLGVDTLVVVGGSADDILREVRRAVDAAGGDGVWTTGCWPESFEEAASPAPPARAGGAQGEIVAVWGPMGSPGRTTIAMGMAEALAETGRRVCLADADTYAPSVTMALGIVEDASGLGVACRQADHGSLVGSTLLAASRHVRGSWHVLGGISRPDRWADLRPSALDRVWDAAREAYDVTVVDVGFCLESDEASGPAWARHRNAAAISAIGAADRVVAVGDSTPLGAARLASAWPSLVGLTHGRSLTVAQNRARSRRRDWVDGIRAMGLEAPVRAVPSDPRAVASCWARGRSLGEGARRSGIRRALAALGAEVVSG